MANAVPTLSDTGFDQSVSGKAIRLFKYYLIADKSQSTEFYTRIVSFAATVSNFVNNEKALGQQVQRDLTNLYTPYFDQVSVTVTLADKAKAYSETEAIINLRIVINVTQNQETYTLNDLIPITEDGEYIINPRS